MVGRERGGSMAYCVACGQPFQDGARFCGSCGAAVSSIQSSAPAPPIKRAFVVEPNCGGRLAVKGFLTALMLAMVFHLATIKENASTQATGILLAFGIGVAFS